MGRPVNVNIPEDGYKSKEQFNNTGSIAASDFAVVADQDSTKKIAFDPSSQTTGHTVTFVAGSNSSDVILTLPTSSGTIAKTDPSDVVWIKYSYTFADFAFAGLSKDLLVVTLDPKQMIQNVLLHASIGFTGGGTSSYAVSVGSVGGDIEDIIEPNGVFNPGGSDSYAQSAGPVIYDFALPTEIRIKAVSDVNLNLATAGSLDVWIQSSILP